MSFITAPIEDDTRQSSCTSPGVQFTFTKVVPVASATARKVISAAGRARAYPPSAYVLGQDLTGQVCGAMVKVDQCVHCQ